MRRVVKTGMGVVNPLNNTVDSTLNSLLLSQSGITRASK